MEQPTILPLSALDQPAAEQAFQLLLDSFYPMFRPISRDREVLRRLFFPCMRPDLFYVFLDSGRVAGLIAHSGHTSRAITIDKGVCVSVFGRAKGSVLAWQLKKIMGEPAVDRPESGYLDFLATAPEFRRLGVAERLMDYAEQSLGYADLTLDVLPGNTPAIRLYEKQGFRPVKAKVGLLRRMAGMNMDVMKKTLT